ncbi:TPA: hypothetical protein VAQ33_001715 [Streptococcus agalactiae]|nr:hypothetical protein [Streptococcus agalactiae]
MHNILRFLGIVIISAVILFSIGSFYDLTLMKNILLICWSFLFDLLVFVFKQRQTAEVLTWYQVVKQFWLFIKCTILIPILVAFIIMKGCLTSISDILIYFYLHLVVVYYTIGMILSLGRIISPEHSMFNKLRK